MNMIDRRFGSLRFKSTEVQDANWHTHYRELIAICSLANHSATPLQHKLSTSVRSPRSFGTFGNDNIKAWSTRWEIACHFPVDGAAA